MDVSLRIVGGDSEFQASLGYRMFQIETLKHAHGTGEERKLEEHKAKEAFISIWEMQKTISSTLLDRMLKEKKKGHKPQR